MAHPQSYFLLKIVLRSDPKPITHLRNNAKEAQFLSLSLMFHMKHRCYRQTAISLEASSYRIISKTLKHSIERSQNYFSYT